MTKFLAGMLAGVCVMGVVWFGVDTYSDFNMRISRLEGFARGLTMMMQQQ